MTIYQLFVDHKLHMTSLSPSKLVRHVLEQGHINVSFMTLPVDVPGGKVTQSHMLEEFAEEHDLNIEMLRRIN